MLTLISRVSPQFVPQFETFLDNWHFMEKTSPEIFMFDLRGMVKIDPKTGAVFLNCPEKWEDKDCETAAKYVILVLGVAQMAISIPKPKENSPSLN